MKRRVSIYTKSNRQYGQKRIHASRNCYNTVLFICCLLVCYRELVVETAQWCDIAIREKIQDITLLLHVVRPLELNSYRLPTAESEVAAGYGNEHLVAFYLVMYSLAAVPCPSVLLA